MSKVLIQRTVAYSVAFTLIYTPILGSLTGTVAVAQVQPTTSYQYDSAGNLKQVTAPLGRITNQTFDVLDRVTQQQFPTTDGGRPTVNLTYDKLDQLSTVSDPRAVVTSYTVDGLANQTGLSSKDTGNTTRTFDAAGRLATSTDARGKLTKYAYDGSGRLIKVTYATGTATVFEYDGGAAGIPSDLGQLTKVTDESGQTVLGYNAFGELTSKVASIAGRAYPIQYTYGTSGAATGKLASMRYPSGSKLNYLYNPTGELSAITLNPGLADGTTSTAAATIIVANITYAPTGQVIGWAWGNSSNTVPNVFTRPIDINGRVTSYPLEPGVNGLRRTLSYDDAGRIIGYTHTRAGAPVTSADQSFDYDPMDRLIKWTSATTTQSYQYDATGNRTQVSVGGSPYGVTVSATSNRLASAAGPLPSKTYTYDAAGNITGDGSKTFVYADNGRMRSVTVNGGTVEYKYNGFGERVSKAGPVALVDSTRAYYVYDAQGRPIGQYASTGKAVEETVYLGSTPVGVLKPNASSVMALYYVHADHIDTPRVIVRAADSVIMWRWDGADPFGVVQPVAISGFTYNGRFPGQIYDRESGLHYNYYRDYDPQSGRYMQSDPVGLGGGINTYGYVGGNPISLIDLNGLQAFAISTPPLPAIGGYNPGLGGEANSNSITDDGAGRGRRRETAAEARRRDECPPGRKDPCDELEKRVRDAKDHMGATYTKGTAVCRSGMSRYELGKRASDWLNLAKARAQRDQTCFGGGDANHQTEQATAWNQVSICQNMMR